MIDNPERRLGDDAPAEPEPDDDTEDQHEPRQPAPDDDDGDPAT